MKNKKIIFIILFAFLLVFTIVFLGVIYLNLNIILIGNNSVNITVKTDYNDSGFEASLFNKSLNDNVKIQSNLNSNKIGKYKINYVITKFGITKSITRTINVIDDKNPIITLNGEETIYIYKGDEYVEKGATAFDNYDGDITKKIDITNNIDNKAIGEYVVNYNVKDSSNNETTLTRNVKVINSKNKTTINNPMVKYVADNNYDISFGYYNLVTGDSYLYNEDKVYFAASLIKIVEALYLYDNNMVDDNIKSYVKKTITVSDNPAHHYLQSVIGKDNLKKYGESLGAKYTLAGGGVCGNTTVNDQLVFLKRLYDITKNDNEELKSWFINDYVNNIKFNNEIKVMHKYGLYDNVYHNVGIVLDEEPYIVIILTGIPNGYSKIVNNLSKIIYEYHLSV